MKQSAQEEMKRTKKPAKRVSINEKEKIILKRMLNTYIILNEKLYRKSYICKEIRICKNKFGRWLEIDLKG